jgi:hypothetical protein
MTRGSRAAPDRHGAARELEPRLPERKVASSFRQQYMRGVQLIAQGTYQLPWSPSLLRLLLDELHIDESLEAFVGDPSTLAEHQYPQAIALAIALRHSWQWRDLEYVAERLGVPLHPEQFRTSARPRTRSRRRRPR